MHPPVHVSFSDELTTLQMMKESQSKDSITVRWDVGLNKKRVAYFVFPKVWIYPPRTFTSRVIYDLLFVHCMGLLVLTVLVVQEDNELRLVPGDELRLRYPGDGTHSGWQSVGHVVCHALIFLKAI